MADDPSLTRATLDLLLSCLDLTSLEGSETEEDVRELSTRARQPDPRDPSAPAAAAVVIYGNLVRVAAAELRGSGVRVASVAGFPHAKAPLEELIGEIRSAVAAGAQEIDMVLDREGLLTGERARAENTIARAKESAGAALLKVILETGELGSDERIRDAATLAMSAGADFLKTSTGKVGSGATLEAARSMMEAARAFHADTGRAVGIKVSGGIRSTGDAARYLQLLDEVLGADWLTPQRFRIGASSLLDDLVAQRRAEARA